ncbi:uncharacterized protein G2W53_023024 [Senna tora]|uniref:Uncharacterized protein n=1 Tax=Senna tora TaxID=362788 RepID=A0A834TN30_9FABA|nr:uncharacterized protein G2W53_023024 [Senna tora]
MEVERVRERNCGKIYEWMKVLALDICIGVIWLVPALFFWGIMFGSWHAARWADRTRIGEQSRCYRIDMFLEDVVAIRKNDAVVTTGLNLNLTITNPCPVRSLHFRRFEVHLIKGGGDTFVMASSSPSSFVIGENDGVSVEVVFNSSTSRMPADEWFRFNGSSSSELFDDSTLVALELGVDVRALLTASKRGWGGRDELVWIRASSLVGGNDDIESIDPENHCRSLDLFVNSLSSSSSFLNLSFTVKNPCLLSSVSFKDGFEVELLLLEEHDDQQPNNLFMSRIVPVLDLGGMDQVSMQVIFNSSSSSSSLMPLHHLISLDTIWRNWTSMNFQLHVHALLRQVFHSKQLAWWNVSCGDLHTLAFNISQHGSSMCNSTLALSLLD